MSTTPEKELERIRLHLPAHVHGITGVEVTGGRGERPKVHFSYYAGDGSNIGYGYADGLAKARVNVEYWGYNPLTFERPEERIPWWERNVLVIETEVAHGMRLSSQDRSDMRDYLQTQGRTHVHEVDALLARVEKRLKQTQD